jgi:CubicO group peptidase (beta-lactamase class C family)
VKAWVLVFLAGAVARAAEPAEEVDALIEREWREGRFPAVAAGIVKKDGLVHARAFGLADRKTGREASPETLFRIGSVTKVFTAALLAALRDRGAVSLDDPVARHLPASVRIPSDPRGASAITLRHLATHGSGLPRIPVNLKPRGRDVYGGYTVKALYEGLSRTTLDRPAGLGYGYSNLGYGLLGHALERAAGKPYETLLREELLAPLGMARTGVQPSSSAVLATGYDGDDPTKQAVPWDLGCLAPAGGLVSSVEDLAKFLALQLRAGEAGVAPLSGGTVAELAEPQRVASGWSFGVGLGWHVSPRGEEGNALWHTGCVAGFHAYAGVVPRRGVAVIFLANATSENCGAGPKLLDLAVKLHGAEPEVEIDPGLKRVAEEVSRHITAEPPPSLKDLFHETFLAEIPLERVRGLLQGVHRKLGRPEGFDIAPGKTSRGARVTYRFAKGKTARCDIEIESGGKIVYFYVKT